MLVQCPNCKTTYKVADEVVKGSTPAFRCSRCRHTFEIDPAANPAPARPQPKTSPPAAPEEELSFSFPAPPLAAPGTVRDEKEAVETAVRERKAEEPAAQIEDVPAAGIADAASNPPIAAPAQGDAPERSRDSDAPEQLSVAAPAPFADAKADSPDVASQVVPMSSYINQRASIFPYLTLFGLLVIGFSFVTALSYAHPKVAEAMVKQIPLLGSVLLRNDHLKDGILIRSMRADYQSIQGNREVFVVTGMALNHNPVVIRQVQITGKVYNDVGKELEEQTIWLGNTISPKIIRGMTSEDIPHLQNLRPLRSFEVPPGDSVPFTIVFLKATKGAKDFTCEVVAAAEI